MLPGNGCGYQGGIKMARRKFENLPDWRKEEIEFREEANNRYPKVKAQDMVDEISLLEKFEKFEKEEKIIEEKKKWRIDSKRRFVKENFLGEYPVELVEKEFILNEKAVSPWNTTIAYVFIDFTILEVVK